MHILLLTVLVSLCNQLHSSDNTAPVIENRLHFKTKFSFYAYHDQPDLEAAQKKILIAHVEELSTNIARDVKPLIAQYAIKSTFLAIKKKNTTKFYLVGISHGSRKVINHPSWYFSVKTKLTKTEKKQLDTFKSELNQLTAKNRSRMDSIYQQMMLPEKPNAPLLDLKVSCNWEIQDKIS